MSANQNPIADSIVNDLNDATYRIKGVLSALNYLSEEIEILSSVCPEASIFDMVREVLEHQSTKIDDAASLLWKSRKVVVE